ncbi:MAG: ATP-dependent dethiobiotin synthetase BioD [Sulfurovum sp. AS07-7]|nr:MAG: ATP-dependent dethiobiotin synthetase BioD [Sulfurovum sp. AS07-7]
MQIKPIFIIATNTNTGKTHTTLKMIDEFAKLGLKPVVFKPIETGVIDIPSDAKTLLEKAKSVNPSLQNLTSFDITSYTFTLPAAPYVADSKKEIDISKIKNDFKKLSLLGDIILIEGAGGLMTPITKELKMIDLISLFDAHTLLVTSSHLGSINDTLLSMEAMKNRQLSFDWCVNIYGDINSFDFITKPYYDDEFPTWWSVENGLSAFAKEYIKNHKNFVCV